MVLVERCRIGYGNHFSSYFQLRPAIDGLLQTSRICPVMNSGMLGVRLALAGSIPSTTHCLQKGFAALLVYNMYDTGF
jgi:hypothetical protein